ncbi:MAG: hypothetical protein AAF488_03180 [Planctomycetota bacterium]
MARIRTVICSLALPLLALTPLRADLVNVIMTGEVEFNQISSGTLGAANPGDAAVVTFTVDSDVFTAGGASVRGYVIDPTTFVLTLGSNSIGLQNPLPPAETAHFSLRNDDPGVDGFMITNAVSFPNGVALNQSGSFGQFRNNSYVTYDGSTLSSLDILDAVGFYSFTGLTVFNWTIDDGPFNAMGLVFTDLTIALAAGDPVFRRGDANNDGAFDISDAIYALAALFTSGAPGLACADSGDANDDGGFDISDAIYTLGALFSSGPAPTDPGPVDCGVDPTDDGLDCADDSTCL